MEEGVKHRRARFPIIRTNKRPNDILAAAPRVSSIDRDIGYLLSKVVCSKRQNEVRVNPVPGPGRPCQRPGRGVLGR